MKKQTLCCMLLMAAGAQLSIAQNCTVNISGATCTGSQLTANTNGNALSSLSWLFQGFSVYYADTVSSPATVAVVAGNRGTGNGADQFGFPPGGIALDSAGNIYIADYQNNRVQKWAPGAARGITVAGGNGQGNNANQLAGPKDVFVDAKGNIYVSDNANARVQKWAPGAAKGITVAGGNGPGSADNQLNGPAGLYVDAAGNIYVADIYNYRVQKWAPGAAKGITVAGGNGYGNGANQFYYPIDVYLDGAGNIYVADVFTENSDDHRVQKWAPGASSGVTVAGGAGVFGYLLSITVDAAGNLYTADNGVNGTSISLIKKWAPGSTSGITVAGGYNNGWDRLSYPTGVALDGSGHLYVMDNYFAPKVKKYTLTNGVVNQQFTPAQPGSYTVQAVYKNGCTATSHSVIITSTPEKPTMMATGNRTGSFCAKGRDTFFVKNPDDNVTYLWTIPAQCSLIANKGDSIIVDIPSRISSGYVTVAASNVCNSERDSMKLQGKPIKPSAITGSTTVAPGSTAMYKVKDNGDIYRWAVPAGAKIIAGQNTATISLKWGTQPGNVNVFAANQCGVTSKQQLYVSVKNTNPIITQLKTTGNTSTLDKNVNLFPNPVKNKATLVLFAVGQQKYNITLQDLAGKVLMRKEAILSAGKNQLAIDMRNYSAGMYIIKIVGNDGETQVLNLVKQ